MPFWRCAARHQHELIEGDVVKTVHVIFVDGSWRVFLFLVGQQEIHL